MRRVFHPPIGGRLRIKQARSDVGPSVQWERSDLFITHEDGRAEKVSEPPGLSAHSKVGVGEPGDTTGAWVGSKEDYSGAASSWSGYKPTSRSGGLNQAPGPRP